MPIASSSRRKSSLSLVALLQIFIGFLLGWYILVTYLRYQPLAQSTSGIKNDGSITWSKLIHDTSLHSKIHSYKLPIVNMASDEFFRNSLPKLVEQNNKLPEIIKKSTAQYECPSTIVKAINEPILNENDYKWCEWALTIGEVEVGKSWGKLVTEERLKYERLSCNIVATTHSNPTCNDGWGDEHLQKWKNNRLNVSFCNIPSGSSFECFENVNKDKFCVGSKMKLDFSRLSNEIVDEKSIRVFNEGFITSDCKEINDHFGFYQGMLGSKNDAKCDHHVDYLLVYGHDHIDNLGHMLQDIMNVWLMMWLFDGRINQVSKEQVVLLHIDGMLNRHKFYGDKMNLFFETYTRNLKGVITANSLGNATLCAENVIFQPNDPKFFVWDSWTIDLPCGFRGPSSLFQRWNFQVRHSYGMLQPSMQTTNEGISIIFIVRKESEDVWSNYRSSRILLNQEDLEKSVYNVTRNLEKEYNVPIKFKSVNLAELKFADQIKLIGQSSLVIGVHGAGVASTMHMSIGTKYCCGVLEIYPKGEFTVARGHGNMARKMGIYYDRIDTLSGEFGGLTLPTEDLIQLQNKIQNIVYKMVNRASCVLPDVRNNIYYT